MKQTFKRIIPPSLWNAARYTNTAIRRLPELPVGCEVGNGSITKLGGFELTVAGQQADTEQQDAQGCQSGADNQPVVTFPDVLSGKGRALFKRGQTQFAEHVFDQGVVGRHSKSLNAVFLLEVLHPQQRGCHPAGSDFVDVRERYK